MSYSTSQSSIYPTVGIEVVNSYNMRLLNNFISKNAYTSSSFANVTGIKLVGTIGMVGCNNISNMGYALSLSGTCVGTNIRENVFNVFDTGVYRYAGSQIGQQGGSGDPSNNSWIPPIIPGSFIRLDGDPGLNPLKINWYYTGAAGSMLDPSVNYIASLYNPSHTTQTSPSNYCTRNNQLSLRIQDINKANDEQQAMSDLDAAYVVKKNLYTLVHQDSIVGLDSLINTNVVQDLISDIEAGPMDEFINIDSLLTNKPDTQLLAYIQSIPVSWQSDVNKQQVNRILLKEIEKKPWDAQDSIWLDFIASVPRNIGGDAVISACAALKKECLELSTSNTQRKKKSELTDLNEKLVLFPIPANDFINFEIVNSDENDKIKSIEIIDVLGKSSDLLKLTSNYTINIKSLAPGYYRLICRTESNKRYQSNFIKQ